MPEQRLLKLAWSDTSRELLGNESSEDPLRYRAADVFSYHVLEAPVRPEESLTIRGTPLFNTVELEKLIKADVVWTITSPNMCFVPRAPYGQREVRARRDGRYGLDDRMLHPQFVCQDFQWISCIPRFTPELWILWWTPTPDDAPLIEGTIILTDVRTLKAEYMAELRQQQSESCEIAFQSLARHPQNTLLSSLATHTQQCLERLTFGLSLHKMRNTIGDLQRSCLDIRGFVTYIDKFYPRHLSNSTQDLSRVHPVDTTIMGGFTHSFSDVQLMHRIGIPVWWIRPSTHFSISDTRVRINGLCKNMVVDERVVIEDFYAPGSDIPAFENIYVGLPGTRLQRQTQRLGCRVVDMVEPTRMAWSTLIKKHVDTNPTFPTQPVHLFSLPPLASLPNLPSTSASVAQNRPSQSLPTSSQANDPSSSSSSSDITPLTTFDPIPPRNGVRPPEISIWQAAVMKIKNAKEKEEEARREESRKKKKQKSKKGSHLNATPAPASTAASSPLNPKSTLYLGYRVPDPNIIMNAQGNNAVVYMATWLAQRSVHLYNLSGKGALLVKSITRQQWLHHLKGILGSIRPDSNTSLAPSEGEDDDNTTTQSNPTVPSKRSQDEGNSGRTASGKRRRWKGQTCGEYLDSLSLRKEKLDKILWYEQTIMLGNEENLREALTPDIQAEVLWELREINWRIELMALDQVLAADQWPADSDGSDDNGHGQERRLKREMMIRRVFPLNPGQRVPDFFPTEIPNVDRGVAAYHWTKRHDAIGQLRALMFSWAGCPENILTLPGHFAPRSSEELECAVVEYYCQAFFDTFGRVPITPCRLPFRARARETPARSFGSLG
ncbi:hypothetical protein MD484_g3367, partial [Candolleomyces efflorescens]